MRAVWTKTVQIKAGATRVVQPQVKRCTPTTHTRCHTLFTFWRTHTSLSDFSERADHPTSWCTPTTLLPKPWTTIYHPSVQFLSVVRGTMDRKTVDQLQRPVKNHPEKNHASPCNEPFKTPLKQPKTFSNHLL